MVRVSVYQTLPCGFMSSTPSTSGQDALTSGSSQSAISAINSRLPTSSGGAALPAEISSTKWRSDRARSRSFASFSNPTSVASRASLCALATRHSCDFRRRTVSRSARTSFSMFRRRAASSTHRTAFLILTSIVPRTVSSTLQRS